MNKGEGETKQVAKKMALFLIYPLSLISPFLFSFRNKKKYEKEKGKEKSRRDRPKRVI